VQGRLRKQPLTTFIETECAQSRQPILITIDHELNYSIDDRAASPLVFEPEVNWPAFAEPNIIGTY
jgi:hypothetical protein